MIKSKSDLKYYLEKDRIASGMKRKKPRPFVDEMWKFKILLRKVEYYNNNKGNWYKLLYILHKYRLNKYKNQLHFDIGLNAFGPGLQIYHAGTIIVNGKARIGKNCRIYNGVNIAKEVVIGDNAYIGPGAKILTGVHLGDNVRIGANAVVSKSIEGSNITVAGIPAKKISDNGSVHVTWEG